MFGDTGKIVRVWKYTYLCAGSGRWGFNCMVGYVKVGVCILRGSKMWRDNSIIWHSPYVHVYCIYHSLDTSEIKHDI